MTAEDTRLSILETQRTAMDSDIKDLKDDLKEFKVDTQENFKDINLALNKLSIQMAKWAGAITVIVVAAQIIISKLISHL